VVSRGSAVLLRVVSLRVVSLRAAPAQRPRQVQATFALVLAGSARCARRLAALSAAPARPAAQRSQLVARPA
jgi:hypothetical protein